MEIQYAMFCTNVQFPQKPQDSVILTAPISNFITQNVSDIEFPLFLTFINSVKGGHKFKIDISNFDGKIIATRNHNFTCDRNSLSHAECVLIKFPIHKTDLLTCSMFLDGKQQGSLKLPIKVEI